jgi:hypothetical protein
VVAVGFEVILLVHLANRPQHPVRRPGGREVLHPRGRLVRTKLEGVADNDFDVEPVVAGRGE